MKITLLTPDTTQKTLPRVRILRKLLEKNFETEIVSVVRNKTTEDLYREEFENYRRIVYDPGIIYQELMKSITGDVIFAVKPVTYSLGLSLSLKQKKKIPVILDIDELEVRNRFPYTDNLWKGLFLSFFRFNNPDSFIYTYIVSKRIKFSDWITSTSSYLQGRYTGSLIPNACDTAFFDPEKYKRDEIRKSMGWDNSKILLYTGSLKSLDEWEKLIIRLNGIEDYNFKICLIGEENKASEKLKKLSDKVITYGFQPHLNIAKLMAAADIYLLPLSDNPRHEGKMPVSLYEAMSSKLPVVAFSVSDIPQVLEGCGYTVPAGDSELFKNKVINLLSDEVQAKSFGEAAREKCVEKYSIEAMAGKMAEIVEKVSKK